MASSLGDNLGSLVRSHHWPSLVGHLLERTQDTVMSAAYINLDELTTKSSWPVEALETINGHSRGVLLTDWVEVFSRRLAHSSESDPRGME